MLIKFNKNICEYLNVKRIQNWDKLFLKCFQDLSSSKDKYQNADFAAKHSLALPIYPELTKEKIGYVVKTIKRFME